MSTTDHRRPHGTGSVRRLTSGRWQARVYRAGRRPVPVGSYARKSDAQGVALTFDDGPDPEGTPRVP